MNMIDICEYGHRTTGPGHEWTSEIEEIQIKKTYFYVDFIRSTGVYQDKDQPYGKTIFPDLTQKTAFLF
jgi:hypothetical protein